MSEKRNGPRLTIKADCFGCAHERSQRYTCQGDSGSDVYCAHPGAVGGEPSGRRHVGDTTWDTPDWCPLLPAARDDLMVNLAQANGVGTAG